MFPRNRLATGLAVAAIVILASGASTVADVSKNNTMYVTFNKPVSLPGVSLRSGTYIFERLDSHANSVVRVLSRDRKTSHYTGFTYPVSRPGDMKSDRVISFAEASPDAVQPIEIWWPENSAGRHFIYPKK